MVKNNAASAVVLCLILVSTLMPNSECSSPPPVAREGDVELIKCQVCKKLASQLYCHVQNKQAQIVPEKITEEQITEIAKNLCNSEKEEAVWIRKIDIVKQGDKLKLEEQDAEGYCYNKCKTLQRACEKVMEDSRQIYHVYLIEPNPRRDGMVDFLCRNATDACRSDPGPLPKDWNPGEAFLPKPSDERNAWLSTESMPGAPCTDKYLTDESMNTKDHGEEHKGKDIHSHPKSGFRKQIGRIGKEVKRFFGKWWTGNSKKNSETPKSENSETLKSDL